MRFSTWILGTASLTLLFLSGCVKFETPCTMADGSRAQVNSQNCPDPSTFGGTGSGTGSGVDIATLERPLALASSFGAAGRLSVDVGGNEDLPKALIKQSAGKVVVVGQSNAIPFGQTTAKYGVSFLRLNTTTGAVDTSFGSMPQGKNVYHSPDGAVAIAGAAVHSSGRILAGYTLTKPDGDKDFGIMSASAEGAPVNELGGALLTARYDFASSFPGAPTTRFDEMKAIALDSQGRLVMAGHTTASGNERRIGVIRLRPDGYLETFQSASAPGFAFDIYDGDAQESHTAPIAASGGIPAIPDFRSGFTVVKVLGGAGSQEPTAMAIDSSNRIVLVGKANLAGQFSDMFILRLDAAGLIDTAFQKSTHDFGLMKDDAANALAMQTDGSILLGGYATNAAGMKEFALMRVSSAGVVDTSFGTNGYARLNLGTHAEIKSLQLQGSKIVALGQYDKASGNPTKQMVVVRFNSNGSIDTTYGTAGVMRFEHNLSGSPAQLIGTASLWDGSGLYLGGSGFMGTSAGKDDMMIWKLQ